MSFISKVLYKVGAVSTRYARYLEKPPVTTHSVIAKESVESIVYSAIPEIRPIYITKSNVNPKVILLLPSLAASGFYGGVATALIVAAKMSILQCRNLLIIQTVISGSSNEQLLKDFYRKNNIDVGSISISIIDLANRVDAEEGQFEASELDLFIASAWSDAYLIQKLRLKFKFLYLVQDYEPIFYSNSDKFVMAENTYLYDNYVPLYNTKLMYLNMLSKRYRAASLFPYWFEPAVSNINSGRVTRNMKKNIFIYGRPAVARNLFHLVLVALKYVFEENLLNKDEWNIFMAGQSNLPAIELINGLEIINMGKMDVEDYVLFSKSIDIAISLMMAPHPNYPTLEFASIGSAVVTTKYEVKDDLSFYSKNIFTADLTLESVIDCIIRSSKISYEERIANLGDNNIGEDWNSALDLVISSISKEFDQLNIK